MNDTTPARPPTLRQREARARKAQDRRRSAWERVTKARAALAQALDGSHSAWERVTKARAALAQALDGFHDCLGHETAAFGALCAARGGQVAAPDPRPPAPETLTLPDVGEED